MHLDITGDKDISMQTGLTLNSQLQTTTGPQLANLMSPINLLFPFKDDHSFLFSSQTTCIASTSLNFNRTLLPTNGFLFFLKELRFFSQNIPKSLNLVREILLISLMSVKFRRNAYLSLQKKKLGAWDFPSFSIESPMSQGISQF